MLLRWALRFMASRAPDFVIGEPERPYMHRWWVIPRNRWFNIYLHAILRSDDDRALHDHPWANCSILLSGAYCEIVPHLILRLAKRPYRYGQPTAAILRRAGSVVFRRPTQAHRLVLLNERPVISLFITGPNVRTWGFYAPQGWVPWQDFTDPNNAGLYRPQPQAAA